MLGYIPLVPICMFVNKICQNYLVLDTQKLCVTLYKSIYDKESIKNEKRCRDGVPKSTQTRKGGIKVKVNIQRPVFTVMGKDVGTLYVYLHFYISPLFVHFFDMASLHHFCKHSQLG